MSVYSFSVIPIPYIDIDLYHILDSDYSYTIMIFSIVGEHTDLMKIVYGLIPVYALKLVFSEKHTEFSWGWLVGLKFYIQTSPVSILVWRVLLSCFHLVRKMNSQNKCALS